MKSILWIPKVNANEWAEGNHPRDDKEERHLGDDEFRSAIHVAGDESKVMRRSQALRSRQHESLVVPGDVPGIVMTLLPCHFLVFGCSCGFRLWTDETNDIVKNSFQDRTSRVEFCSKRLHVAGNIRTEEQTKVVRATAIQLHLHS